MANRLSRASSCHASSPLAPDGVSPEFKVEAQKVADLFKSGDYAGADFHAQWMLKETVRYGLRICPAAIHSRGDACQPGPRSRSHPFRRRGQPAYLTQCHELLASPAHTGQFPPQLSVAPGGHHQPAEHADAPRRQQRHVEEGAEGVPTKLPPGKDCVRRSARGGGCAVDREAGKLRTAGCEDRPRPGQTGSTSLYRRRFTMEHVSGIINSIALRCGKTRQPLTYVPGDEWTVPDGLQDCVVDVDGETGNHVPAHRTCGVSAAFAVRRRSLLCSGA